MPETSLKKPSFPYTPIERFGTFPKISHAALKKPSFPYTPIERFGTFPKISHAS
jgi:hypothetical protein